MPKKIRTYGYTVIKRFLNFYLKLTKTRLNDSEVMQRKRVWPELTQELSLGIFI